MVTYDIGCARKGRSGRKSSSIFFNIESGIQNIRTCTWKEPLADSSMHADRAAGPVETIPSFGYASLDKLILYLDRLNIYGYGAEHTCFFADHCVRIFESPFLLSCQNNMSEVRKSGWMS
jgi:hypothetical protein